MVKKKEPAFEEELAQLEEIVKLLDSEDLPLEKAIESYEQGVKLSYRLNRTLEEAQRKIEIVRRTNDGGHQAEPFGEEDAGE